MIDFSNVKAVAISEGVVTQVEVDGNVIWNNRELPDGYVALDYIETDGTQYINTGFTPDSNSRIVLNFEMTQMNTVSQIVGSRNTTSSKAFAFGTNAENTWRFGYGNAYYGAGNSDTNRHILDFNKNVVSLDGVVCATAANGTFAGAHPIHIGAVKATSKLYYGYARFYSCQIYDDGMLVRDLVPCINTNGQPGMYDKQNGVHYWNAGSGEFITSE